MIENHKEIWQNCLTVIKDNLPDVTFNTWFKPIIPEKIENNVLTINVPSQFFYEFLEEHYIDLLKKVLKKELGSNAKLKYSIIIDNSNFTNSKFYTPGITVLIWQTLQLKFLLKVKIQIGRAHV